MKIKNFKLKIKKIASFLTPNSWLKKARLSRKLYYYTVIGLILFIGGGSLLWQMARPGGADAAWFNENWSYRKSIAISTHATEEKNVYISVPPIPTRIYVGTYTGNGTSQSIDAGFQPTFVLIKGDLSNAGVFTTSTMGNDVTKPITGNTAAGAGMITSITSTGFTVGSSTNANQAATTYYYVAIRDMTGTNYKSFSYTGTGGANVETQSACGFTPNLVIVGGAGATSAVFRSSHSGQGSSLFNGAEDTNRITGYVTNGFTVGTSSVVNTSSASYYGICVKAADEFMATTQYAGNGVDDRSITGIGFQPDFTLTKRLDLSTPAALRFLDNVGDDAPTVTQSNSADRIQAFVSDGFQVGTDTSVNTDTFTYNSFSFKTYPSGGGGSGGTAIDTSDTTKFQSDCGDLRFTDQDGNLLPYYIVSGCGTSTTVVHVFFKTFPAGAQTIYYYYGNPSAGNGFSSSDFSTEASTYTMGSEGSEEVGPSPLAYWDLDDETGTVAKDRSSNSYNGTLTGATLPAWTAKGQCVSSSCLFFNGITSNVSVASTVPGVKTIGFWANPSSSASGELMALNSSTHIRMTNGVVSAPGMTSPVVYVNGSLNGTVVTNNWNYVTVTSSTAVSASAITLGMGPLGVLRGFLDDVKLYQDVLSNGQIKAIYVARGSKTGSGAVLGEQDMSFLSQGLVGYWKMDELTANTCTGGTADNCDSSGNSNNGAWNGDVTVSLPGKFGTGTTFDGTGDYVGSMTSGTLKPTTAITISMWTKAAVSQGANARLISTQSTQNIGYDIELVSGVPIFHAAINGSDRNITSSTTINDNTWHHIVATWDGSTQRIFIDGRLAATSTNRTGTITYGGPTLIFGANNSASPANLYTGVLDEVRIYNRGLSIDEAQSLYNFAQGPAGYWDFEARKGTSVDDKSGNTNPATLSNGPEWGRGKFGSGVDFDGSDDVATVTNATAIDLDSSGGHAFSAWVYADSDGESDVGQIYNKGATTFLRVDSQSGNSLDVEASLDLVTADATLNISSAVTTGSWNYITVTYDDDSDDEISIYVNGVLRGTSTDGNGSPSSDANDLLIGGPTTANFDGKIDEFKFYNYATNAKRIVEDMNGGHPAGGSPVGSAIGHWKFDSGSGNVASNSGTLGSTAHGNMLNFSSPPSQISGWSQNGKFGKALNFDGADDIVEAGSDTGFDDMASFTASAWINPRTGGENSAGRIIDKSNATTPTNGWVFFINSSSQLRFTVDHATDLNVISSTTVPLSSWSHVTVTWDGSLTATNVHIYLNGKEVSYGTQTNGSGARVTDVAEQLKIGNDKSRARTFDGWIDEVKIYNYALIASEVRVDYNRSGGLAFGALGTDIDGKSASNSASRMYCPPGDTTAVCAPLGEWRFEERKASIATDTSTNTNDGTLINGPQFTAGKIGSGLSFTSTSSQSVDVGNTISGVKSVSYWVKPTSTTNSMLALSGSAYITSSTGTISATGFTSPTIYVNGVVSSTLVANTWQQVIVTTGTSVSSSAIKFGLANGTYFNGLIDEVKVYDYTLNASQVAWDYNRGKPIIHLKANECQGSTLNDSSGNGRSGAITLQGTGTTSPGTCTTSGAWANGGQGKFNYALDLDGTDDYVSVATPALPTGDFSYSSWVNLGANTDENLFLTADGSGGDEFRVYIDSSNHVAVYTNNTLQVTSNRSVSTGVWTNIVVTRSGSTVRIYLNGQQDTSTGTDGTALSFSTCSLLIGVDSSATCDTGTLNKYLDGKIDEVQVYNFALTLPQIQLLFNQNSAVRFGPATGSP